MTLRRSLRTAPAARERERRLEQPLRPAPRDAHRIEDGFVAVATALGPRREQPFSGLADDHEIDRVRARVGERDAHAGKHANRPEAGIELETIAQVDLRHDLCAVGIAHVRVSHSAEKDGVG